jgi:hypothetical protein
MKKPLDVFFFFFFAFKGNVVISLCNQRLKDQKSLESLFFLLLRIFKLFYYVSEMLND